MGNKNTPGKLEFNAQANTLRDERGLVADCNGMPPHYRDLFLAAPELLAALEKMLEQTDGGMTPCAAMYVFRAKEAIAKARGEG